MSISEGENRENNGMPFKLNLLTSERWNIFMNLMCQKQSKVNGNQLVSTMILVTEAANSTLISHTEAADSFWITLIISLQCICPGTHVDTTWHELSTIKTPSQIKNHPRLTHTHTTTTRAPRVVRIHGYHQGVLAWGELLCLWDVWLGFMGQRTSASTPGPNVSIRTPYRILDQCHSLHPSVGFVWRLMGVCSQRAREQKMGKAYSSSLNFCSL